jgi:hypothetical protein
MQISSQGFKLFLVNIEIKFVLHYKKSDAVFSVEKYYQQSQTL